jgi:hypothetical protein
MKKNTAQKQNTVDFHTPFSEQEGLILLSIFINYQEQRLYATLLYAKFR